MNISDSSWKNWINPFFFEEIVYTDEEAREIVVCLSKHKFDRDDKVELHVSRNSITIYKNHKLILKKDDYDYVRMVLEHLVFGIYSEDCFVSERISEEMIKDLEKKELEFIMQFPEQIKLFWDNCLSKVQQRLFKYKSKDLILESKAHDEVLKFISLKIKQIFIDKLESEQLNFDSKIFTCERGYLIFTGFKNEIITEANEYASYSFLFNQLLKDELIHEMRHKKFIEYLSKSHNSKILDKYIQFNSASSKANHEAYSRYKKQFQ